MMKKHIKYLLLATVAVASISLTSCVKAYEEECIETIHRPQVEIHPDSPDWDDKETQKID